MGESGDQKKWDARYAVGGAVTEPPQAARVLDEFQYLLPSSGTALDLACGTGGNALLLAEKGLQTHAWDISNIAIERLNSLAGSRGLAVHTRVCDVVQFPPKANRYDVIVVSRFLERRLVPAIINALTSAGLVFYQTFIQEKSPESGPNNPVYLLEENELLRLFSGLRILVYREEGNVGDISQGFRNEAMIVAQKSCGSPI